MSGISCRAIRCTRGSGRPVRSALGRAGRRLLGAPAFALPLLLAAPAPAPAQCPDADPDRAVVVSIVQGLEELDETREVTLVPLASFDEEPLTRCAELELGDELRCESGEVTVEVRCPGGSVMTLSERFRVALAPAEEDQDCKVDLKSGTAQAASTEPTGIESGPVGAGALRTQYEVRAERVRGSPRQTVTVFDGEVQVRARNLREVAQVSAGRKILHQGMEWERAELAVDDVRRAANVLARTATARAKKSETAEDEPRAVYGRFVDLYQKTLIRPDDPSARLDLATAQLRYELSDQALYQLRKAETAETAEPDLAARVAITQSMAHAQLGQESEAETYKQKALRIDPRVLERIDVQREELLQPTPQIRPEAVERPTYTPTADRELRIEARPVVDGPRAQLEIRIEDAAGEPVSGATVEIRAGGGTFAASGGTRVRGTTDSEGRFRTKWSCSPCAPAYVLELKATRDGYREATGQVRIDLRRR